MPRPVRIEFPGASYHVKKGGRGLLTSRLPGHLETGYYRISGANHHVMGCGGDLICIGQEETTTIIIYTEDWGIDWDQMHAVFDWGVDHLLNGIITLDPEVLCFL